jgi:hypothetical protein
MEIKLPMRPKPPNFGVAGEIRDEKLNRENATRLLARAQEFAGAPGDDVAGWKISDRLARGEQQVGQQTLTIARDGRFAVEVKLDEKLSRFGFDGKEFWSAVGDDAPMVVDAERLARNPFAAQGYLLATLQTKEPLASIGKVIIDSADKASKQLSYRLKAIDSDTDEFFVWLSVFDAAGQPHVRVLKSAETYDDERTPAVLYHDWKATGGVQWPQRRQIVAGMAEAVALDIVTNQVDTLSEVADSLFQKPDHGSQK